MQKNSNKTLIQMIFITLAILLLATSLEVSFAADQRVDLNSPSGLNSHNNISAAIEAIDNTQTNSIITINQGTYKGQANTNLNIAKNITFQGNGSRENVRIDAENMNRIFQITASSINVTFINITFLNGQAIDSNGGAIHNIYSNSVLTFMRFSHDSVSFCLILFFYLALS